MSYPTLDFKNALDHDLARAQLNERLLGARLGVTQQAISKWRQRGFPPIYRLRELIEIFGEDSQVAQLDMHRIMADATHLRVEPPTPAGLVQAAVADSALEHGLAAALPSSLRKYLAPETVSVGSAKVRPDYASERVIVELKTCVARTTPFPASQYLLALAAMRAVRPGTRTAALCMVGDPSQEGCRVSPGRTQMAEALGVTVWYARNAQDAARMIAKAEGVTLEAEELEEAE